MEELKPLDGEKYEFEYRGMSILIPVSDVSDYQDSDERNNWLVFSLIMHHKWKRKYLFGFQIETSSRSKKLSIESLDAWNEARSYGEYALEKGLCQNKWHIFLVAAYQDSDARKKIKEFTIKDISKMMKLSIRNFIEEMEAVVTEKVELENLPRWNFLKKSENQVQFGYYDDNCYFRSGLFPHAAKQLEFEQS